jgi:glucosamine-6-phosphate deaminase
MINPVKSFQVDKLQVKVYNDKAEMGDASADFVSWHLQVAIKKNGLANLILATGTSQFPFLEALKKLHVDWMKITVFHLDEYIGLSDKHPASFRKYLKERILDEVKPRQIYFLNGDSMDIEAELRNYEKLLQCHAVDIACIGIGENGHIAFNDPPVADFNDPHLVKIVQLDEACRRQQLGEGWFPTLADVPGEALSLTIPAIMESKAICCVVPDERKSTAVFNTIHGEISTTCPASILRNHPDAVLFLDKEAAMKISQ